MEWFESWFDTEEYHELYAARDDNEAGHFIKLLFNKLSVPSPEKVLDLACGRGRHARQIQGLGYVVDAIDLSENNIQHAKTFENDGLRFFVHDMRVPYPNKYGIIVNLFTSFGYFENLNENQKVLNNVSDALQTNGLFVLDFLNIDWLKTNLVSKSQKTIGKRTYSIRKWMDEQFVHKTINIESPTEPEKQFQERVQLLSGHQIEDMVVAAGLTPIETFGSYRLDPFVEAVSDRFILIAQKRS